MSIDHKQTTRLAPVLEAAEWQALWEWHRSQERLSADAAQYEKAAWHKQRHETLAAYISPRDEWERNWSRA